MVISRRLSFSAMTTALTVAGISLAGVAVGTPNTQDANRLCQQLDADPTTARLYYEINRMSPDDDTLNLAFQTACPQYAPLYGYLQRIKDVPEAIAEIDLEGNLGATPIYEWTEQQLSTYAPV